MNVLIDTSIWSLALRRKAENLNPGETATVTELTNLIGAGRAKIIGLIRQELLSGIKGASQYEKLRLTLRSFHDEVLSTSDFEAAAKASNACRNVGTASTVPDMLICAVASSRDWSVYATDPDFEDYANILPLKLHRRKM